MYSPASTMHLVVCETVTCSLLYYFLVHNVYIKKIWLITLGNKVIIKIPFSAGALTVLKSNPTQIEVSYVSFCCQYFESHIVHGTVHDVLSAVLEWEMGMTRS